MATESETNTKSTPPPDLPIRCQVVTPERIVVDEWVSQVIVPLPDGEFGIAKNHDPVIARLGYGSFRMKAGSASRNYYVDGGFLQIRDNIVVILTNRAVDVSSLNAAQIDEEIATVKGRTTHSAADLEGRMIDLDKLRTRRRLAGSAK
jgi:F-type H+-transporting ATPase subunit epsilon